MVVLGVPTAMLRDSRNEYQPPDLWSIPAEYLTAAGLYSNAHVLKCYELGAAPATVAAAEPSVTHLAGALPDQTITAPVSPLRRPPPSPRRRSSRWLFCTGIGTRPRARRPLPT